MTLGIEATRGPGHERAGALSRSEPGARPFSTMSTVRITGFVSREVRTPGLPMGTSSESAIALNRELSGYSGSREQRVTFGPKYANERASVNIPAAPDVQDVHALE